MMNKRRTFVLAGVIFLSLAIAIIYFGWVRDPQQKPAPADIARGDQETRKQDTSDPASNDKQGARQTALDAQPSTDTETIVSQKGDDDLSQKTTRTWSSGPIVFTTADRTFSIARDYNQRVEIGVKNRGTEAYQIVAGVSELGHGLLGGFVGAGTAQHPAELAAGAEMKLSLYLFAQDAQRRAYHSQLSVKDSKTGELLATTPVTIHIPLPVFDVEAVVGKADPGTLGRVVKLTNKGGVLSDLTVAPGKGLQGRVFFEPSVDHAYLGTGRSLSFRVYPRLSTSFTKLDGEIVVRGAGQEMNMPLRFELPAGKSVFVSTSHSTPGASAHCFFCTNRPNVDTRFGGLIGNPLSPLDERNPELAKGNWSWQWAQIGPLRFRTVFGKAPEGVVGGGGGGGGRLSGSRHSLPPLGLSGDSHLPQTDEEDLLTPDPDENRNDYLRTGGIDSIEFSPTGGQQQGPRGRRVREAYAVFRPHIYGDNHPEAMVAFSGGPAKSRDVLQVWHTNRFDGKQGRQILFKAWDGYGQSALLRTVRLTETKTFGQWPCVAALPSHRALIVWEQTTAHDGPPSLVYRLSGPGYRSWTQTTPVPRAQAEGEIGHYDPITVYTPDNHVILVWQRGTGQAARIMISRTTDAGKFGLPVSPEALPTGATRPVPRIADDGTLHIVFQAPAAGAGASQAATAVYHALSRDGGATFESLTRLSAENVDSGEADLLVLGETVHAVFRSGENWKSRIMHSVLRGAGAKWTQPVPVSPADHYAEFASLCPLKEGGVSLEYYGGERKQVETTTAGGASISDLFKKTTLKRYRLVLKRDTETWTAPARLLTRFPTVQAAWLQVNFRLRTDRRNYLPHELKVLLNGYELLSEKDVIPEGTFLLPFDPSILRVDERGLSHNTIGLRTRHMDQANYSNATGFRLQARNVFLERLIVAETQQKADALLATETESVNHHRPDVGLFVFDPKEDIPTTPKAGEDVPISLLLGNLGESTAEDVRIEVYDARPSLKNDSNQKPVTKVLVVGKLEPMKFQKITVHIPYNGKGHYYVKASSKGDDFDLTNNVHVVSFVTPKPAPIPFRTYGANESLAVELGDDPEPPFLVRLLEPGTDRQVAQVVRGKLSGPLPSGKYQLAVTRYQFEGREVLFPEIFEYREGEKLRIKLRTAIEIVIPTGLGQAWRWEVVQADKPDEIVQWHRGVHPTMLVPPGDYHVVLRPSFHETGSKRLVWTRRITVKTDEHLVLRLDCGVKLSLPKAAGAFTTWEVVKADDPKQVVQWHRPDRPIMLVPPGEYKLTLHPTAYDQGSQRLVWPTKFRVEAGRFTEIKPDSGVKLALPKAAGAFSSWEVVKADDPKQVVQWHRQNRATMLVPPGEYKLALRPTPYDQGSKRLVWPTKFRVELGRFVAINLDSGVTLTLPKAAGAFSSWEVVKADDPKQVVQWHRQKGATMLVPPGEYKLALRPTPYDQWSKRLIWPTKFRVEAGRFVNLKPDSLITLILPEGTSRLWSWDVVSADAPDKIVQWLRGNRLTMLVPPGEYKVALHPTGYDSNSQRLLWPEKLRLKKGQSFTLNLKTGLRIVGPDKAEPEFEFRILEQTEKKRVQWGRNTWSVQFIPPGVYTVEIRKNQKWQLLAEKVRVVSGRITEVKLKELPGK